MKHEPCKLSLVYKKWPEYTICEVLRQIFRSTENDDIRIKARIAITMAKKMDRKLRKYKKNWDEGFWEQNFPS